MIQSSAKARQKAAKLKNPETLLEEFDKLEKCRIVIGKSRYVRAYQKMKITSGKISPLIFHLYNGRDLCTYLGAFMLLIVEFFEEK